MGKKVSIIIPAYNEEKRIGKTLKSYTEYFDKQYKENYEIIVIPNNCTDKTEEVVAQFNVRTHTIPNINDKGMAVRAGFRVADTDLIGFVDADGSTPPEAFDDLIKNINNYDGIIASRWMQGAQVSPKQPLTRRIASRTFNLLVRTFFGLKLHDSQCGAKLFTKKCAKETIEKLDITRWAFDVDFLFKAKKLGFKITEIPTVWADDPNSVLNVKKASIEMFLALLRLRLVYSPLKGVVTIYDKLPESLKIHHRL